MTGCRVSVVIPVYNAGQYLGECLDSVLGQTTKEIEVLCVDDGSTDDSAKVLADYAAKRGKLLKRKKPVTEEQKAEFIRSFDWRAMTEQDERVWQKIFEHFDD